MNLGIDNNQGLIYEGFSLYGRAVWPSPLISPMEIASSETKNLSLVASSSPRLIDYKYLFREDAYDPVTRVRRGRVYTKGDTQPQYWQVNPHPALPAEIREADSDGLIRRSMATFYSNPVRPYIDKVNGQPIVILGIKSNFTVWTIINIEKLATGEELFTLKARQTFDALPVLKIDQIPDTKKFSVTETLNLLVQDIHKAGPESVIDRARDAVAAILACYLDSLGKHKPGVDLAELIKKLKDDNGQKNNVISASDIVRILHSRVKPSVKEKFKVRKIKEQDAELAVQCVGTILCDFGWGEWV